MKLLLGKLFQTGSMLALFTVSLIACNGRLPIETSTNNQNTTELNTDASGSASGIIGGSLASQNSVVAQSVVGLYDVQRGALCTGSLIENNIVLTAAHCVGNQMVVIFGVDLKNKIAAYPITDAAVHPLWSKNQNNDVNTGDVALLKFTGALPEGYAPAKLLTDKSYLKNNALVTLAGFGITNGVTHQGSAILRYTQVSIADNRFSFTEVKLDQTHGTGACHGDSGGPAYVTVNGVLELWGITSRGVDDPKNDCTEYSAYTNALTYKTWINKTINQLLNYGQET